MVGPSSSRLEENVYSSYHSNASSMGEDEDTKDSGSGSKRQRVHFSCTECHRRKQKCNRQTPCQHCIARKIPERCKTFQPGEDPADLNSRVARMERSMQVNFQKMFDMLQQQKTSTGAPSSAPTILQQIQADAAGSEAGDEVLEGNRSPNAQQYAPSKAMSMKIDNLLDTFSVSQSAGNLTDPVRSIEGATDLDALMYEYGATDSITQSLLSIFPTRKLADALMDHFFQDINWLRQPMSQTKTRSLYENFWASGPMLTANNINVYASLVFIMAIAICSIERPDVVPDDPRAVRLTARRLFYAGRRALLASTMLGREDLQQVLGYSLASRFLLLDRRITEAWTCVSNAVKTAHSIGLHRDGTKLHLSAQETDVRRRVWSFVYYTDRNLCMNLGRPTQIEESVVDTQTPSEVDDCDVFPEMFKPSIMPKTKEGSAAPSPLSYTRHRHRLAVIMGKIISTYQNLHSPAHYGDIISIDKELEQHRKGLPSFFRSEINQKGELYHMDTAWDEGYPFVPIHRYLLESEIDHIRVSLHRPYLLRTSNKAGHRYEYSRRSCIAAAHRNILLRKDIIGSLIEQFGENSIPKAYHLHLGTYKTLNSLIIVGMYLLVTPQAEDAEMLLGHLRFYSEMFKKKRASKSYIRDEMKDREASIINLFLQRIEETRAETAKKEEEQKGGRSSKGSIKRENENENESSRSSGAGKRAKRTPSGLHNETTSQSNKTSEEDTAGVLLDLNQSGRKTSTSTAPPYNELAPSWNKDRHENEKEIMAPWPYLPLNTHQNTSSRPSSNSNGSVLSPANESTQSEESLNTVTTSAQQLFESWFRYNAFDTMDIGTLNNGLETASSKMQDHFPPSFDDKNNRFQAPFSMSEGDALSQHQNHQTTTTSAPYQNNSNSNGGGVQLSTLPAPIWNSTPASGVKQSNNTDAYVVNNGSSNMSAGLGISGPSALPGTMTTAGSTSNISNSSASIPFASLGASMAVSGDQFNDASFDPNFWQSLIDKISS